MTHMEIVWSALGRPFKEVGMSSAQERIDEVKKPDPKAMLKYQLERDVMLDFIRSVAPKLDPLGVVRVALAHVQSSPALRKCSVRSVVRGVAEAAKLELTIDGTLGHAYLVPYGGEAKMMIGYRGIEQLAYRSGLVSRFHADTINENDQIHYSEGVQVEFSHQRPLADRGEVIGAYATAHLTLGGPPLIVVMSLEEIHARRARSASWKRKPATSPWETDYEAMCRKTPIRELGKRIPYPILQTASLRDEARDLDDVPNVPDDKDVVDLGDAVVEEETP